MNSFNKRVFLISTLFAGLIAAASCFIVINNVQMSPTLWYMFDIIGRLLLFPAVSLVFNNFEFLWGSEFHQLWFYLALGFNSLFYGFLMERIVSWSESQDN